MEELDKNLIILDGMEKEKKILEAKINKKRVEVVKYIQKEDIKSYKNDVAAVSYIQRKNIVIENLPDVLYRLKEDGFEKYIEVVKNVTKGLKEDIKSGKFEFEGVEIQAKEYLQVKFNKNIKKK